MPEIVGPIVSLAQICAGAFVIGLFLTVGAIAGFKLGTRWFGPINLSVNISGPIPVVLVED